MIFQITIAGKPATQGSKIPFPGHKFGVKDTCKALPAWRDLVAFSARKIYRGELIREAALSMTICFIRPRPKNHYRANGELKPNAAKYPTTRPDSIKMARAIEDALAGVIYHDDSQIVKHQLFKRYGDMYETKILIEKMERGCS